MARLSVLLVALATVRGSASEGNTSTTNETINETTTETTTTTAHTTTGTTFTETDHSADRRFFFSQTVVFTGFNGTLEQVQMGMSAELLAVLNTTADDQGWSREALEGLPVQVVELTQRSPTGSQISGVIGQATQDLPNAVEVVQAPFQILGGALDLLGVDFRRLTNSNLFDDELPTFRATVQAIITGSARADEFYDYVRSRGGIANRVLFQFEPMAGSRHRQDDPVVAEITTTTTVTTTEHTTTATMTETTATPSSGSVGTASNPDDSNSPVTVAVLTSAGVVLAAAAAVGGALAVKRRRDKANNNQGSNQPDLEAADDDEVATRTETIAI